METKQEKLTDWIEWPKWSFLRTTTNDEYVGGAGMATVKQKKQKYGNLVLGQSNWKDQTRMATITMDRERGREKKTKRTSVGNTPLRDIINNHAQIVNWGSETFIHSFMELHRKEDVFQEKCHKWNWILDSWVQFYGCYVHTKMKVNSTSKEGERERTREKGASWHLVQKMKEVRKKKLYDCTTMAN